MKLAIDQGHVASKFWVWFLNSIIKKTHRREGFVGSMWEWSLEGLPRSLIFVLNRERASLTVGEGWNIGVELRA